MKFIYKIFRLTPNKREDVIQVTSGLHIVMNVLIATTKVVVGLLASSIAIISEGINNASDAMNSILTLVGTRLSLKHPNKDHPFGYGRVEYLTSLVVSSLILISGIEALISSIKLVLKPQVLNVSYLSLIIVGVFAVVKYVMGVYTIGVAKKTQSDSLEAVGLDCRNDSFISIVTIASASLFILFNLNIDAYAGIFTSFMIIKAGYGILKETISKLLGQAGDEELAKKLYEIIRAQDYIINAADMMLHNYGPDAYSGSVNIELDQKLTVGEVYQKLHKLQLEIMYKLKVVMVFGIYAVDNDNPKSKELREIIAKYVIKKEHVKSYHAVYIDENNDDIYCDLIVDYELLDWESLEKEFKEYMKDFYPDKNIILTIETEYV